MRAIPVRSICSSCIIQDSVGNGSMTGRLREGPRLCQKLVARGALQQTTGFETRPQHLERARPRGWGRTNGDLADRRGNLAADSLIQTIISGFRELAARLSGAAAQLSQNPRVFSERPVAPQNANRLLTASWHPLSLAGKRLATGAGAKKGTILERPRSPCLRNIDASLRRAH